MRTAAAIMFVVTLAASAAWQAALAQDGLGISARLAPDFRALRERPLFAPDRSPPIVNAPQPEIAVAAPEPEVEATGAVMPPDWELVGVVRSARMTGAIFRTPADGRSFSLRQGESRDGWELAEIGRSEVTLQNGTERALKRFPDGSSAPSPGGAMGSMPELRGSGGREPVEL